MPTNKRTRVKKCTVSFGPGLKRRLCAKGYIEVRDVKGIQACLEFAQAITWMCVTGCSFGVGQKGIENLPPLVRGYCKPFLLGYSRNRSTLDAVARATRVEIRIELYTERTIQVQAVFFEKARNELLTLEAAFELFTGEFLGGGGGEPSVRPSTPSISQ